MHYNPILLFVWAALATCFLALLIYRGQLTRYEDEQLFLNGEDEHYPQQRQTNIVRKVRQIEPVLRAFGGAAGLVTASVVGIYVWDAWQRIQ